MTSKSSFGFDSRTTPCLSVEFRKEIIFFEKKKNLLRNRQIMLSSVGIYKISIIYQDIVGILTILLIGVVETKCH